MWLDKRRNVLESELRLLALRFLYYVVGQSPLDDRHYDILERDLMPYLPEDSALRKPGSSSESDYPLPIIAMARWLVKPSGYVNFDRIVDEWVKLR